MPMPCAATSTRPAACAALSTSAARFTDPTHVYHRREQATPSAPVAPAPSTSMARFVNLALVYHRRERASPLAPDDPPTRTEPPVYHPVAIHRDPKHVHLMVTHRVAGVLRPIDWPVLAADTAATPPTLTGLTVPTRAGPLPVTPCSWAAKRQPVVSRSSAEVEYRAVANDVAKASWLRQLLQELHSPLHQAALVYRQCQRGLPLHQSRAASVHEARGDRPALRPRACRRL
jgi:hypothetical protein